MNSKQNNYNLLYFFAHMEQANILRCTTENDYFHLFLQYLKQNTAQYTYIGK